MVPTTYPKKLDLPPTTAFTIQQIRSFTKEQKETIGKNQIPEFTMEQIRTFTPEQMRDLAIEPKLIAEAMRLSKEEKQIELARKLSLEKQEQFDIEQEEILTATSLSSDTTSETPESWITEEEMLKQGVRPKGSKIIRSQTEYGNNIYQEKVITIISTPSTPAENSLDLQITNDDIAVVDNAKSTITEIISEQEQIDINKAIALEALSIKRKDKNSNIIGLYLEEQEQLKNDEALADDNGLATITEIISEQEEIDINKAIALETLSIKRKDKNSNIIGLYLEEQEQLKNDEALAIALQEQFNMEQNELAKLTRAQVNLIQIQMKELKNNIIMLKQQKINKFLNSFIKLLTFGTTDKNKENELKIINKQNELLKKEKELKKLKATPSLFSKFTKQQANNEAVTLPAINVNQSRTRQM